MKKIIVTLALSLVFFMVLPSYISASPSEPIPSNEENTEMDSTSKQNVPVEVTEEISNEDVPVNEDVAGDNAPNLESIEPEEMEEEVLPESKVDVPVTQELTESIVTEGPEVPVPDIDEVKEETSPLIEPVKDKELDVIKPIEFKITDKFFEVTSDQLPVYDNSTGNLVLIGYLTKGEVYPRVRDYGNWHRIEFGGRYGYVLKSSTVPADGTSLKNINKSYTNSKRSFQTLSDVTVYDNTSGKLVPFATIKKDEHYLVASDYGNWYRIILSNRVGYVKKSEVKVQFTKNDSHFEVVEDGVAVYDNRSGKLIQVGTLTKGQVYPRVSDYGNWHRLQFGEYYGYVLKSATLPATGEKVKYQASKIKDNGRTLTTKENVKVYDNSSGSLVQFATIKKGKTYPIVRDYGNWYEIILSNRVGYVRKTEVNVPFFKNDKYFEVMEEKAPVYDNRSGKLVQVGVLEKGQVFPRIRDYGNWHRIQFADYYGYVLETLTLPSTNKALRNELKVVKQNGRMLKAKKDIEVYDNSSGRLVQFATIDNGKQYTSIRDYGNWYEVAFSNRVGYVRKGDVDASFISSDRYFKVIEEDLPIYDNRSGKLVKVGTLTKGQEYQRVRDYGNWHRIQFGDYYGYVLKSSTKPTNGKSISNKNSKYRNSGDFKILKDTVVYDNTSGSLVEFASLTKNAELQYVNKYGNWYRILVSDRVGYVHKDDIKILAWKIFLDPGHGGIDGGASGNGLKEKDVTLKIALKTKEYLQQYAGAEVMLSRENDKTLALAERSSAANNWGADLLVSIHTNAAASSAATGFESFRYPTAGGDTSRFQALLHNSILNQIGLSNRGIKTADFHMVREPKMVAVLTENGFISNRNDAAKMKQTSWIEKVAKGHAEAIAQFLNLTKK